MDKRRRTRATATKDFPVPGGPCEHINVTRASQIIRDNTCMCFFICKKQAYKRLTADEQFVFIV